MAKKRKPQTQETDRYPEASMSTLESAPIWSDYIRQYIGVVDGQPGTGIFINWDRVARTQSYDGLAQFDLYDEIERDPHVAGILRTLKLTAASMDWRVEPSDESARAKAIASFVETNFRNMRNFTQDMYELLDAEGKGFAVSEVIWEVGYETKIVSFMNRPQRRFQFDAVTRAPMLRTIANPYMGEPLPERKFVIHRVSSKYENPFGEGLDQSLYWPWFFKHTVMKFWTTHLEVSMAPVPFVQHPQNASPKLKDEALDIARQMRRSGYGRLPENFKVLWAEAQTAAQTAQSYEKYIDLCNSEMTKCALGQVLTTEGSAKGGAGSKALGEVHSDVLAMRAKYSAEALASTFNAGPVRWLVDANFAGVKDYPRFTFKTEENVDREYEANIVKLLKDAGYTTDREWIEKTIQVDLVDDEPAPPPVVLPGQPPLAENPDDKKTEGVKQ